MNNNPALIIDGLLLIVLLVAAVRGYTDGFFTSVVRLLGTVGSLVAGLYIADNYSQQIFNSYLKEPITERSYNYLVQTSQNIDIETALSQMLGEFPQEFLTATIEKAESAFSQIITPNMESAVYLVDEFIAPAMISVISVLLFIATFFIIKLVCSVMARLFKAINNVPLLGTANKLAGLFAGIVTGSINIILLSFLMSIIVVVTGNSLSFLNAEIINQSRLLALTGTINPFLS